MTSNKWHLRYNTPVFICLALIAMLLILPTGFEGNLVFRESDIQPARVLATDESTVIDTGLVRSGEQRCRLEILSGPFQGQIAEGRNMLNGSFEQDKLFSIGDKALVRINYQDGEILNISMIDHYRAPWELLLAALFILLLIVFAGRTGLRAVLSFVLTVLMIWKVLVPLYLKGWNPVGVGLTITLILTVLIIALVYGFDRRCAAAVSGSFLGILAACVMGGVFTGLFQIHGAVMSYSESLLLAYSGGYVALLMVFMAQGTPLSNILNYKYVAAELLHTVIGSFGLVTVAPFTAFCAGVFLSKCKGVCNKKQENE